MICIFNIPWGASRTPIVAKLPSKKVSPFKLKNNNKIKIKRDNINGTKYMEAARSAASMYLVAREARHHLYVVVFDFDSVFYCLFFLFFCF